MYGTVARLQLRPGMEDQMKALAQEFVGRSVPGYIGEYVYRMDNEPGIYYMAALFADRAAYLANANSPEQHAFFLRFRELLAADPEWHDGEVIWPLG